MDDYTTEELEEMDEMMELEEEEQPSVSPAVEEAAMKVVGFLILCVVFLPVIFTADFETYVICGFIAAILLFAKPWWKSQETFDREQERMWGR